MPHSIPLITAIAAGFGIALILGFLAVRIKVPALVGYLVAGIIIGPATPGFVADAQIASRLSRDRRHVADVWRRTALFA